MDTTFQDLKIGDQFHVYSDPFRKYMKLYWTYRMEDERFAGLNTAVIEGPERGSLTYIMNETVVI